MRLDDPDAFPARLDQVLRPATRLAWRNIAPYLPHGGYLAGGTGVAVHLAHRESRDLDFFTTGPLDVEDLYEALERSSLQLVVDRLLPRAGNIEVTLGETKIEITDASRARLVEPPSVLAGVQVAGLGDLLAMKLATITKRRQQRDYEDLRAIEMLGGRRLEEGLALARERYELRDEAGVVGMVAALAQVDECPPDELVGTSSETLVEFFRSRLPDIVASLSRWDSSALAPELADKVATILR